MRYLILLISLFVFNCSELPEEPLPHLTYEAAEYEQVVDIHHVRMTTLSLMVGDSVMSVASHVSHCEFYVELTHPDGWVEDLFIEGYLSEAGGCSRMYYQVDRPDVGEYSMHAYQEPRQAALMNRDVVFECETTGVVISGAINSLTCVLGVVGYDRFGNPTD